MDNPSSRHPWRVLVADDNQDIRELIAAKLCRHFSVCEPVGDGKRLVEAALASRPDVIVSDVNMPVLDGLGAMSALRECGHHIPFVMLSAEPDRARECLARGAAAFVSKLDLGTELVQAVFAALEGRRYVSSGARGMGTE